MAPPSLPRTILPSRQPCYGVVALLVVHWCQIQIGDDCFACESRGYGTDHDRQGVCQISDHQMVYRVRIGINIGFNISTPGYVMHITCPVSCCVACEEKQIMLPAELRMLGYCSMTCVRRRLVHRLALSVLMLPCHYPQ